MSYILNWNISEKKNSVSSFKETFGSGPVFGKSIKFGFGKLHISAWTRDVISKEGIEEILFGN